MPTDPTGTAPEYLDYARRALRTAQLNLDDGDYVASINRAYYAIFYAANAVLELEGLQRSKHSHVMSLFRQKYVKTGLIEVEYSDIYGDAFTYRNEGDYERSTSPSQELAEITLQSAQKFVERIGRLLTELKK